VWRFLRWGGKATYLTSTEWLPSLGGPQRSSGEDIGVGIGIDCGDISFGEFGRTHQYLKAIGIVVNRLARNQAASSGETLVTEAVRDRVPTALEQSAPKIHSLKGFDRPIALWAA
jgi:adenylate cyclase